MSEGSVAMATGSMDEEVEINCIIEAVLFRPEGQRKGSTTWRGRKETGRVIEGGGRDRRGKSTINTHGQRIR